MPFPKKKKKVESDTLKWLREQREKEWETQVKEFQRVHLEPNIKKEELKRLKEKYGIKEQREQKDPNN